MADTTAAAAVASVAGSSGPVPLPLAGRVAIVTGASRGIGRTIAAHLSALGASVVLGYASSAHLPALGASVVLGYASSAAEADTLAAELPRAVAVRADVSEEAGVRSQFDAAESAFGCATPHILVANAGMLDDKYPSVADTATADFDRVLAVNTRGAFLCLGEAGRRQEEAEPVQAEPSQNLASRVAAIMASSPSDIALQAAVDGNLSLLKKMASKVDLRGAKDAVGNTALHYSASRGCLESCRFLVEESGIDANAVSKTGVTSMSYAALGGNVQVMRYLLDHAGDPAMPDERGTTPLHLAAMRGHCQAVRLLLSKGVPVDPVDHRGAPLHMAASNDHVEVVKVLLEHAADLNKVVHHFASPLMVACCEKSLKCIKLLIEAGADVNAPGGYSASAPLIQAVKFGLTDSVKLLLEAGADPNIPNLHGAIPIVLAAFNHGRELVEVLFPRTKPIPSLPDWSVDGIIRTVNSPRFNPLQPAVSREERIADWKLRGKEAFAKEDYVTAITFYGLVIQINPLDASMFANKSVCWLRLKNGVQALDNARKCRLMRPRWSKAWYREGAALSFMKDYDGAADAFRQALQLDRKSEEIGEALRKAEKAAEDSRRV